MLTPKADLLLSNWLPGSPNRVTETSVRFYSAGRRRGARDHRRVTQTPETNGAAVGEDREELVQQRCAAMSNLRLNWSGNWALGIPLIVLTR
jgi:hypothetical protein